MARCQSKDMGSKFTKTLQTKVSWKDKDDTRGDPKSKPYEEKKQVQERIKKGLCFEGGDKWNREHKCRSSQALVLIEDEKSEDEADCIDETLRQGIELEEAESYEHQEAKLSLHDMSGVQKPTSNRVMAWIGKLEVTLFVDSGWLDIKFHQFQHCH